MHTPSTFPLSVHSTLPQLTTLVFISGDCRQGEQGKQGRGFGNDKFFNYDYRPYLGQPLQRIEENKKILRKLQVKGDKPHSFLFLEIIRPKERDGPSNECKTHTTTTMSHSRPS